MDFKKFLAPLMMLAATTTSFAETTSVPTTTLPLQSLPGFFRFSYDNISMPNNIKRTGLVGLNYFAEITPLVYAGMGTYGAVSGAQGGLFTLGVGAGVHREFYPHWWGDAGLYVGGGGGKSALVGGGLMVRPHVGIAYSWQWARLGLHYSYIDFPYGSIRSQQIGLDLDLPYDFYYVNYQNAQMPWINLKNILPPDGKYFDLQRNDFGLMLQAYRQASGTKNTLGNVQDGTISVVGAELDHYLTDNVFWSIQTDGAYHGIPNGYMDILGGLGYRWNLNSYGFALVPQFSAGAGGGGQVETGGGFLVHPQLGLQWPLLPSLAARVGGGYLWAPNGNLKAYTVSGELLYHLDMLTANSKGMHINTDRFRIQDWRIQIFNQTYLHPQRNDDSLNSSVELVGLQLDQLITPYFFISYQATSAWKGTNTGGLATGMLGPGIQSPEFCHQKLQAFAEVLVGAGGGGGIALGGGSVAEAIAGLHYHLTPAVGLQASVGQIKALKNDLNTPIVNLGLAIRFGTVDQ
jgi:hypothetical protein